MLTWNSGFTRLMGTVLFGKTYSRSLRVIAIVLCLAGAMWAQAPVPQGCSMGTMSIGPEQYSLAATGGDGHYAWAVVSGALPSGLSLRTDGPPYFPPDASAGIIGVATTPGTYNFTLSVTSAGQTAYEDCSMKISALTTKTWWDTPEGFVNQPYSYQLVALNNNGPVTFQVGNGTLPPGVSLTPNGLLTGAPTASGSYHIDYTVTDSVDTVWHNLTVNVYDVRITSPGVLPNGTQGQPYSYTITADGGAGNYTFTQSGGNGGLPGGLTLSSSGQISGTINAGAYNYGFTVTATDGNGVSYSKVMSLPVVGVPPTLPQLSTWGALLVDCTYAFPCGRRVSASGGVAPYTWQVNGLPSGMDRNTPPVSTWMQSNDLELWGSPLQLGTFNVQATATDANNHSVNSTYPLHISPLYLDCCVPGGTMNVPYSYTLRVLGGQGPYTAKLISGLLPAGIALDENALTLSGTPLESGNFGGSVRFTDSQQNTLVASFGVNIANVPGTTLNIGTYNDLGTWPVGIYIGNYQFWACCAPSYTWSVVGGTVPPGLTIGADGSMQGTPTTIGTYTFMLRVADPANSANFTVRQFQMTITPIVISVSGNLPYATVGTPYSTSLAANGGNGPLTWTVRYGSFLPPGLALDANGTLHGTPTSSGNYQCDVIATDSAGNFAIAGFNLVIYAAGEYPPIDLPVGSGWTVSLGSVVLEMNATGGKPPYTYSYTPGAPIVPGMRPQAGPPLSVNFSPNAIGGFYGVVTQPGTYNTSIRVTDSTGATFDKPITFVVSPIAIGTAYDLPPATVNVPYSLDFTATGASGNYSWTQNNLLPPGMTFSSTGQISGTPTNAGDYYGGVTATDLGDTSISVGYGFHIRVNAFAITNSGLLPQGTVNAAYSTTLSAPNCGTGCTWALVGGNLPNGLSLNSTTGVISGTPTNSWNWSFTVQASGSNGTAQKVFAIYIASNTAQSLTLTNWWTSQAYQIIGGDFGWALEAVGGRPPYTWSVQGLPPGVSVVNSGASYRWGFSSEPYIAGRPLQTGNYTLTVSVTDTANTTVTQTVPMTVTGINYEWQYTNLPMSGTQLKYGQPYSQRVLVYGGTSNYTFTPLGALPAGLNLSSDPVTAPNTGALVSGTPANTGTYSTPVLVTDEAGNTGFQNLNFNISSPTGVGVGFNSGPYLGTFQQGNFFNINLSPYGGTTPYTITALSPLPAGFALESGSSLLSNVGANTYQLVGQPLATGTFSFTLQVQDAAGNVGVRTFTLNVASFTLLTPTNLADGSVGVPYSQVLQVTGSGAVNWSVNAGSALPPGLAISAGAIVGTPTTVGNYTFSLVATDASGLSVPFNFTLRISNLGIANTSPLPAITAGVPYSYTMNAAGATGVLTWSLINGQPTGLKINAATGELYGTITAQNVGTYNMVIGVTNGTMTFSKRFTMYVVASQPPIFTYSTGTTLPDMSVGQSLSYYIIPSGGVPPYTWAVAPGSSLPPGLQFVSGSALPPNYAPGFTLIMGTATTAGQYSFDLIATDSLGAQVRRTFNLKVSEITILSGTPRNAFVGQAYAAQFTAVGGTAPYTFTMTPINTATDMLPPGLTMSSSGLISGTATSTGNYQFFVNAVDSAGHTFRRSYTLYVNNNSQYNLRVTNTNPNDVWAGGGAYQFLQTSGSSTYSWSLVSGSLPPGMALSSNPNFFGANATVIVGEPSVPGVYTYTLRATDTKNPANYADHTFRYHIGAMQLISPLTGFGVPRLPAGQVGQPYSFTLKAAGGTPPYTYTISPFNWLPDGLTLSSDGVISGTPTSSGSYNGGYNLVLNIADATGESVNYTLQPLIIGSAASPAPLLASGTTFIDDVSVGVAAAQKLDDLVTGGVPPYAWSVASGSSLPPGLALMGGNGVPTYVAGIPTVAGQYTVALTATDSIGQTQTTTYNLSVSPIALTPDALPNGKVGAPYSVSLVPYGGVPPYNVYTIPWYDLPAGLTLDASGVISGTPTHAGNFRIMIEVADGATPTNYLDKVYRVTIDNAAGEAPAVSLSPKPLQIYYVQGSAPGTVPVTVGASSGTQPFNLSLTGLGQLSSTSGVASTTVDLNLDYNLPVGTYAGLLAVNAPQSANQFDAVPVTLTIAPQPPCSYSLNPTSGSMPAIGGDGSVSLSTQSYCSWSATASDPWITLTSDASGNGSGTLKYTVAPNTGVAQRTGTITLNDQTYTITQFGSSCSYAINPATLNVPAGGGQAVISVYASDASCSWTASGLGATPTNGTGSGSVTVTLPANVNPASQVLNATIAGQLLTVNQTGVNCTVALTSYSANVKAAGGTGSVAVNTLAGCSYNTVTGPSWISVTSGGSGVGSGTLMYTVEPNSTTVTRSGSLSIGGQNFVIAQQGLACTVTIDTAGLASPYGANGGAGNIGITTNGANCSWTAASSDNWAALSKTSGTGSGSIGVTLTSNAASTSSRATTITVSGQAVGVTQAGTSCEYSLRSPTASIPASGGSGSVGVVAPGVCGWSASSNNPDWLTITSSGTAGNSDVSFAVQRNLAAAPRTGTLTIAGQTYTVTQAPAPCSYSLAQTSTTVASDGVASAMLGFSTGATGCSPTALSYSNWITVTAPTFDGANGTIGYTVAPNPLGTTRQGTLQVGDQTFTVTQTGAACGYSLGSYGQAFDKNGGSGSINGSGTAVGCTPTVGTDQPSFITLEPLSGPTGNVFTLPFDVSTFNSMTTTVRRGTITFGGQIFTIKQTSW